MTKKILLFFVLVFITHISKAQLEPAQYSIKNLKANTPYTDMSTSFWGKNRVIYTSSKNSRGIVKTRVTHREKSKIFLETFSGLIDADFEIKYIKKVKMDFDPDFNLSNVAFTKDLQHVFFTQNTSDRKRGKINLKLFKADVTKKGKWINIRELPFNSKKYNCAHPTMSDDGTKLYFSSDMPGGFGGSDIYVVDLLQNETYGKPKNLGGYINSKGRDNFPEVNNGLLYFSSDRPGGLGGLDVYMVPSQDLFTKPVNIGVPLNSKYDDFSFVINGKTRRGYFTSNRPEGKGGDDLYAFTQETAIKSCTQTIEGIVKDTDTDLIVKDAIVNIFDDKGQWLNRFSTGGDGKFLIKLNKCNKNYKIEASKKYYSKDYSDIIYSPDKKTHQLSLYIEKEDLVTINEEKKKDKLIPDGITTLDVKSIDFLLNKYEIRLKSAEELNKVVAIMKENPTMIVEFSAHTDSRGPDDWNMELSIKRAEEVVHYIVNKGIAYNRIYGRGYGETRPLNHCINDVECTEKEYIVNRRTEFTILAQ